MEQLQSGSPSLYTDPLLSNQSRFIKIKSSEKIHPQPNPVPAAVINGKMHRIFHGKWRRALARCRDREAGRKIKFVMLPDKLLSSHRGERHFMIFSNCDVLAKMEA